MSMQKIKKEPKVSAPNVNVSPGVQLDAALTSIGTQIDLKADIAAVDAVTGSRSNLNTTDKTNLVAAINELNNKVNTDNDYNNLTNKPIERTEDDGFRIVAVGAAGRIDNTASGRNAFAEGAKTTAGGMGSHAEGGGSNALGNYSHAEGSSTVARGQKSHAEGQYCIANGTNSHAEGDATVAYGDSSHAEGETHTFEIQVTRAYTANDTVIYIDTPIPTGCVIYDTDESLARAVSCQYQEENGDYKVTFNGINEDLAVDDTIHVDYCAYGISSHAEGSNTHAGGDYSHAEGNYTQTTNEAEHASGKYNKSTYNVTQFSVGIGTADNARVNAFEITTDGKMYVKGVGNYDGTNATATGVKALGEAGWISISIDDIADVSKVSGNFSNSYAFGDATIDVTESPAINGAFAVNTGTVSGDYSFAEGKHTTASGTAAHAEGYQSEATADCAHAEGRKTHATANAAHAEGQLTYANGKQSHAEGSNSTAGADRSHAEGYYTTANGANSHAEGFHTLTRNAGEHACGNYNKSTSNVTLFSIGCGYEGQYGAPDTRQNAYEVDMSGNVYIKGIGNYDGTNIDDTGVESVQEVITKLTQQIAALTNNL